MVVYITLKTEKHNSVDVVESEQATITMALLACDGVPLVANLNNVFLCFLKRIVEK